MSPRWTITPSWRRALPPGFVVPMQPSLVVRVPEGPDWQHEIKHDGYRLIARKEGPRVRLWSRTGRDWRNVFTGIALAVAALPATSLMIDGEAVVLREDGTSDFHALASSRARAACLIAFDILQLDGLDMRASPLEARRDLLAAILREHTSASLFFSEAVEGDRARRSSGTPAPWAWKGSSRSGRDRPIDPARAPCGARSAARTTRGKGRASCSYGAGPHPPKPKDSGADDSAAEGAVSSSN